jgi:hypothetical protein
LTVTVLIPVKSCNACVELLEPNGPTNGAVKLLVEVIKACGFLYSINPLLAKLVPLHAPGYKYILQAPVDPAVDVIVAVFQTPVIEGVGSVAAPLTTPSRLAR